MTQRLVVSLLVLAAAMIASALIGNFALQARDRYMPGLTFATEGDTRLRLLRANGADATNGVPEQIGDFQRAMSSETPSQVHDRSGDGFSEGSIAQGVEFIGRLAFYLSILAAALVATALLVELALEARDVAQYMPGQTFAKVGDARIRYRLLGAERPGVLVVFLSGLNGSIEQSDYFQRAVSSMLPTLAYDRAGYGFSKGSKAHTAEEQARELAALLQALKLEGPVVLVGYSFSGPIARIFAARFPEKTAGLYLIEPAMPELDVRMPEVQTPRRYFARFIVHQLLASALGYTRLTQRMRSWQGPDSLVERRAEAVLARRPHYWALAQEWYALPETWRQTYNTSMPASLPIEIAFSRQIPDDETAKSVAKLYAELLAELVARSSRGKLLELENVDHSELLRAGPVLDRLIVRVKQLAQAGADW